MKRSLLPVFASLKVRLLTHGFQASRRSRLASWALLACSVIGGLATAASFVRDHGDGPVAWNRSLVPGFTMVFIAWVFGPLLLGGVDDALDPRRLALLPLRRRDLSEGLAVGALIGYLPLGTTIALSGVLVSYAHGPSAVLVAAAVVVEVASCLAVSRLVAVLLARASNSRRGRDLAVVGASVSAAALWLATQGIGTFGESTVDRFVAGLRWFPPGMLGAAVIDASTGRALVGAARIGVVGVVCAVSFTAWSRNTERLLTSASSARSGTTRDRPIGSPVRLLARLANRLGGPLAGAVFVKEVRYLVRSPARRSALVVATVMGVPFVLLHVMRAGGFRPGTVIYAPAALLFGLGTVNNLIGADSTSLWLEMSSGARLREMLIGRGLAAVPYLILPSLLATGALALLSGSAQHLVAILAIVIGGWGVPLGVGSYLSIRSPFAQADDQNPFSNTRAAGGPSAMTVLAVAALGTMIVAVLDLPLVWAALTLPTEAWLVVVAPVWACTVWLVLVGLAVRRVSRRGVDLVSLLSARPERL